MIFAMTGLKMLSDKKDCVENLIGTLQCDCCERHKTNRPNRWGPWTELPYHYTQVGDDPQNCRCPCRHKARILCRMHPDTTPSWESVPAMCRRADQIMSVFVN